MRTPNFSYWECLKRLEWVDIMTSVTKVRISYYVEWTDGGVVLRVSVHKTPSFDISDSFDGCEKLIASNSAFEATTASKGADTHIHRNPISKLRDSGCVFCPFHHYLTD
jgi:hypothetical protein